MILSIPIRWRSGTSCGRMKLAPTKQLSRQTSEGPLPIAAASPAPNFDSAVDLFVAAADSRPW